MKFGVAGCRDRENLGLVRSVDLLDGHMSPGGLCRPSDNFGAILATPERATANGKDFVLALAVAYEFQGRFTVAAPSITLFIGQCRLPSRPERCLTDGTLGYQRRRGVSLSCVYSEPISPRTGISPALTRYVRATLGRWPNEASPARCAFERGRWPQTHVRTDNRGRPDDMSLASQAAGAASGVAVASLMAVIESYPKSAVMPRAFQRVRESSPR